MRRRIEQQRGGRYPDAAVAARRRWMLRCLAGGAGWGCSGWLDRWHGWVGSGGRSCLASAASERRAARDVPWLAEVQCPPPKVPDAAPRLEPLLVDAQGQPIRDRQAWECQRRRVREQWLSFLGAYDMPRMPLEVELLEEDYPEGCVRQLVRYESEPELPVEAYLLKPRNVQQRRNDDPSVGQVKLPGVVALHSTVDYTIRQPAGLEGDPNLHFGLMLAQRGFVVCCPRCFLWQGEGSYVEHVARTQARHPGTTGMAKMLWDAMRAVDLVETLPEVDPDRLGAIGHSLGAKEVLYLVAFDERIRAAVFSEGGIGIAFSNWEAPWYLGPAVARGEWLHDHHELLALAAPRPMLIVGGNSADGDRSWPYVEAALPVYELYGKPARLGLFNHGQGHTLPAEVASKCCEWLEAYCQ
ncbi:MAG: dienelactone hydrolase family protein [Pirellulales bacterium]|nr:dienelactone hydrolase family protein [Pirellulales bacterium]